MSESTWTPTPAAETVVTLKKLIAGYVLMPTDTEVLETAEAGIRRAIDRLNVRTWNWALTYDDIAFVADQQDYELQSSFKAPRNFALFDSAEKAVSRLSYKQWKVFLAEHQDMRSGGDPCVYSCANVHTLGTLSLDVSPSADWVVTYPTGRIFYFRRIQYPGSEGTSIDVPSEVIGFIQASAEGFTADRYAVQKAAPAYQRAERFHHELVVDDAHGGQTDWE